MNLCLFHNLNSGIGVEFQGTHRSLKISVIDSFQYNGIKTLSSSMSKRHQYFFMVSYLDCYTVAIKNIDGVLTLMMLTSLYHCTEKNL